MEQLEFTREKLVILWILGNFVYYFIDHGIEIIEIVIVFIMFFEMRADLTKKNIF